MNCKKTTQHGLSRITQLKIDWDFKVRPSLRRAYVDSIIRVCRSQGTRVRRIQVNRSEHGGQHYRVDIEPSIDPELAVEIQAVLADDPMRVGFCKARIKSRLTQWNILHEAIGVRLRTIYKE